MAFGKHPFQSAYLSKDEQQEFKDRVINRE
jgi:hypothetical protein